MSTSNKPRSGPSRLRSSEAPARAGAQRARPAPAHRPASAPRPVAPRTPDPDASDDDEADAFEDALRLQKVLAQAGVASRRKAEALIAAGRVKIDGKVARELGVRVDPLRSRIEVDGKAVAIEPPVYLVLHKPEGIVSSSVGPMDERGRATVLSLVRGLQQRVYSVGRLDYRSRGVLLLTNDGALAARLTHPRYRVPKTYHVKFQGRLDEAIIEALLGGVTLDDGVTTRPLEELVVIRETEANTWVQMTLTQGLNRQIRRMGEAVGRPVLKLIRVAFADITTDGLPEGQARTLSPVEVGALRALVGAPPPRVDPAAPVLAPARARRTSPDSGPEREGPARGGAPRRTSGAKAAAPAVGARSSKPATEPRASRPASGPRATSPAGGPPRLEARAAPAAARPSRGERGERGERVAAPPQPTAARSKPGSRLAAPAAGRSAPTGARSAAGDARSKDVDTRAKPRSGATKAAGARAKPGAGAAKPSRATSSAGPDASSSGRPARRGPRSSR